MALMDIIIWIAIGCGALFFMGAVFAKLYKRTTKEEAFVRTGFGGEKVILDGGAVKLPFLHELVKVNMRTLRLQVDRKNEEGLITQDRMRVDVTAEFYVRVKPEKESIAKAAQTLGNRTLQPELLKELLQGKFVDSLRSVAAGLTMEQLHEQRAEFVQSVQASLSEDLIKNGLELESVSLTALDQTAREYFKEDNAFDAHGLAKLTSITEIKREERNKIEQETRVRIEQKNLEAEKMSLQVHRDEEMAKLNQRREVEIATAEQETMIARERAARKREAEEARIVESQKEREAAISSEQTIREREIAQQQAVEERDITAKRLVAEANIEREQSVEIRRQNANIAVAQKSEEQSKAEAQAAQARSLRVKEEENVETVRETAKAEREKSIKLIQAREEAERQAIDVTVAAEADKQAAEDRAEAVLTEAKAAAEKIRIVAEADQKRFEVEAYGEKAINEAKNILSQELMAFELRKIIAQVAPQIIAEAVKPAERIESIKVIQTGNIASSGGHGSNGSSGGGSGLPSQLTDALLNYRLNIPLVDKLLGEIGLDPSNTEGLTSSLTDLVDGKSSAPAATATSNGDAPAAAARPKGTPAKD